MNQINHNLFTYFISLLLTLPALASAQSQTTDIRPKAERLLSNDLLEVFKGVTHDGSYNFDVEGIAGGHYTETHFDDARITYLEGDMEFNGVWTLRNDMMCYTYADDSLSGGCFRVYQIKNCFYFYSDLLIEHSDEIDRDYWTARSVKKGEEPLCVAGMS